MQSEVISARTAAAQAEQRATDAETRVLGVRGEGAVDTRLLDGQLETVQVHAVGLRCWIQARDDRKRKTHS